MVFATEAVEGLTGWVNADLLKLKVLLCFLKIKLQHKYDIYKETKELSFSQAFLLLLCVLSSCALKVIPDTRKGRGTGSCFLNFPSEMNPWNERTIVEMWKVMFLMIYCSIQLNKFQGISNRNIFSAKSEGTGGMQYDTGIWQDFWMRGTLHTTWEKHFLKMKCELVSISVLTALTVKYLHVVFHIMMCIIACSQESTRMQNKELLYMMTEEDFWGRSLFWNWVWTSVFYRWWVIWVFNILQQSQCSCKPAGIMTKEFLPQQRPHYSLKFSKRFV